ncbi:class I SAM-dependent methyltransferase [Pseudazoarcus pumilus]|uniref:Class I SAM-dependent methyltransferase n=1 Tax=Pseudazoarcus pumilus TaxID=2067960 RepID=A0A2I6S9T5_9RHOO|nr:class I SAM-dependent methyltransferase [Pseudazoarcus pumilus]AUN96009.1 class I SAM-dependent methyltransferase [Pseudazoarcus pumilus]
MKAAQAFWDKAAPRYAKIRIRDETSYRRKVEITQQYLRPDWSVLEFGCGTGSTAIEHAPHVRHILATDVSGRMLEIAQDKARAAGIDNITFRCGTLDSAELPAGGFDAVLGLNVLHLLEDVAGAIARVHHLLRPGGMFVSSTALVGELKLHWRMAIPLMQTLGLAPHVSRIKHAELCAMLADAGFVIEHDWQPGRASAFIVARRPE